MRREISFISIKFFFLLCRGSAKNLDKFCIVRFVENYMALVNGEFERNCDEKMRK